MSTPPGPPPVPPGGGDLTFVLPDLGREQPTGAADEEPAVFVQAADRGGEATTIPVSAFHVAQGRSVGRAPQRPGDDLPWIAREVTSRSSPQPADSPWTVRRSETWLRTSTSTMRRLRHDAVSLSWSAAWLAVTAAGPSRGRRRRR